ncbi:conserved protein of unknown function [Modestobacter italicus]|uniref:Uncharacterized protein n=1 Tax=Modestobacter italicus (strain DSM 44449 / CECT 9708 / BC 501) TaxID=2732864 RepID=I4EX50_MODI5|nr:conserved protein of unknown function [Modestobacter marinus]
MLPVPRERPSACTSVVEPLSTFASVEFRRSWPTRRSNHEAGAAREYARRREAEAGTGEPFPDGTFTSRPNQASRMFDVRLSDERFAAVQEIAESQHLLMSTMARALLLDRPEEERGGSRRAPVATWEDAGVRHMVSEGRHAAHARLVT